MRRTPLLLSLVLVAGLAVVIGPQSAGAACEPGPPVYDSSVTSPGDAIPGFGDRAATSDELFDYVATVDADSARVTSGTFATSVNDKPLAYALVSASDNLADLSTIVQDNNALRDPRATSAGQAAAIAHESPAIVWYYANVHGNEPSPGDAARASCTSLRRGPTARSRTSWTTSWSA
jgi:hypothetical protein